MPKTIVTHRNPDLDAIMAPWLLVRFDQSDYGDAEFAFVPAGTTYKDEPVDSNPEVVHVDVGYGRYDHHQPGALETCASKLVYEDLLAQKKIAKEDKPLAEMVKYAMEIDHFADCFWPEAGEPRFAFSLSEIIPAMHRLQIHDNEAVMRMVFVYLDAAYQRLKDWYKGIEAIGEGQIFKTAWGKTLVAKTGADDVSKIAQKMGHQMVVIYDPEKGYLKIKLRPDATRDLQAVYDKIHEIEPESWFLHNSGLMLFSGSDKGNTRPPTKLTLEDLVQIIKGVS